MAEKTKIQWADSTWSPWRGCQHALLPDGTEHPGCAHCYAERQSKRNPRLFGSWGPQGVRVVNANWRTPLDWDRKAAQARERRFVFPSMCDVFEDFEGHVLTTSGAVIADCRACGHTGPLGINACLPPHCHACGGGDVGVGSLAGTRKLFFQLTDVTPHLDWLILTKRPQNVLRMWPDVDVRCAIRDPDGRLENPHGHRRANVYLGVSVSDQKTADALIPELLKLRELVAKLFVSAEPLLGPVDLSRWTTRTLRDGSRVTSKPHGIDLVIVGGESGQSARPCDVRWIRDLIAQCRAASGVRAFCKQLGSDWAKRNGSEDSKGGIVDEWPEDIRVQEYPAV